MNNISPTYGMIEYFDQKPYSDLHWDDPSACGEDQD